MRTAKSVLTLSAAIVLGIALSLRNSLADTTNGPAVGTIDLQFENAPAFMLVEWVTRLTHGSVVVPYDLNFPVTYRTERKVTLEEALQGIDGVLVTNGYHLVKGDGADYRVVKVAEMNSISNRSHIDLELQGDKLVVNGNTIVDRKDLPKTLAVLSKPDTELWIYHAVTAPRGPANNEAMDLLLSSRGLDARKMFLKFVPEGR